MLQLRVHGEPAAIEALADELEGVPGARHVAVVNGGRGEAVATADLRAEAADRVLRILERLNVGSDDFVLVRLDTVGMLPDDTVALVWADVLGRAYARARPRGRYYVLMAAAGVVAAFAVINKSSVLIVGAMAISPDLLPITAACTGLVLLRGEIVLRGLAVLAVGLAVTGAVAAIVTALIDLLGLLPDGFTLGAIPAAQTHVGASTILVALAAGVAGMLAVETRASAAVGVAISVTTIPAVAYLGVAAGIGELGKSLSALWVLGANVVMMLVGGSSALALQRLWAARR